MRYTVLVALLIGVMAAPMTATAGGCEFDPTLDAKVFTYSYPAGVGFDVGVFEFEVGLSEWGSKACGNVTLDIIRALRLIPWMRDVLPSEPVAETALLQSYFIGHGLSGFGLPKPET